ncbi:Conserved_hypothetical protein [Hexamita inflata]|uniref:Uncharacterized protein n=1 Tax=Hexamita inflata TaxID=28002 RepID=A0AA86R9C0_9EUKA|nr:Conserved hypothetical protein [Hexamita inflata]
MKTATITALIAVSILVFKRLKQNKTYKIIKHHSNDPKLLSIIQDINNQNIKVPKQPNKIQPPKPVFRRFTVQYQDDENDFINYDLLSDESCCKNPVIILCFMGGHSKSACIRRLANAFYENKHPVYVLLQRSTLDIKINPNVKKFRAFRSSITDDIDMLLGLIPEKKVILAGYSLGGFAAAHYMTDFDIECKNRDKVEKIIVGYVELDLSYNVVMPMRVQKHVGQVIVPFIEENRELYNKNGFDNAYLDDIIKHQTVLYYDEKIWCKYYNQTMEQFYKWGAVQTRLPDIKVPTLFINTYDDIITGKNIPFEELAKYPNINQIQINYGNHLGTVTLDGKDITSNVCAEWCE